MPLRWSGFLGTLMTVLVVSCANPSLSTDLIPAGDTPARGASSSSVFPDGKYKIVAKHSLKSLDVQDFSRADGGNVQQWSNSPGRNQLWIVTRQADGFYEIKSDWSGKCLDVTEFSLQDGAKIQQWSASGASNQRWAIEAVGGGAYKVVSKLSGKVLDVKEFSTLDGANVQQWGYGGGPNQQFYFRGVATTVTEADTHHLVQFYHALYNADGPTSSTNCGPTSLAMALSVQNKLPTGLTQNQRIRYGRALISGVEFTIQVGGTTVVQSKLGENGNVAYSNLGQIQNAVKQLGGTTHSVIDQGSLNSSLIAGFPVVLAGYIDTEWKKNFPSAASLYGRSPDIGHFVAVLAMTADNTYIVDDPMYRGGALEMTWDQLSSFPQSGRGIDGGNSVEF